MFSEGNTTQKSIEIMEISTFIINSFTLIRVNIQTTRLTKLQEKGRQYINNLTELAIEQDKGVAHDPLNRIQHP